MFGCSTPVLLLPSVFGYFRIALLDLHNLDMTGKLRLQWIEWARLYSCVMIPIVSISFFWNLTCCMKWPVVTFGIINILMKLHNHKLQVLDNQTMCGFPEYIGNKGVLLATISRREVLVTQFLDNAIFAGSSKFQKVLIPKHSMVFFSQGLGVLMRYLRIFDHQFYEWKI